MENKPSNLETLLSEVYRYLTLRLDDLKLRTVDGLSSLFSLLFCALAGLLLLNMALIFIFGALSVWLAACIGSLPWAMLITGGVFILLAVILLLARKRLITDKLVRVIIKMFFEEKNGDNESE